MSADPVNEAVGPPPAKKVVHSANEDVGPLAAKKVADSANYEDRSGANKEEISASIYILETVHFGRLQIIPYIGHPDE